MSIESKTGRLVFDLVDVLKNRCISGVMQDVGDLERDNLESVVNSLTRTFEEFKPNFSSNVAGFVANEIQTTVENSTTNTTSTTKKTTRRKSK